MRGAMSSSSASGGRWYSGRGLADVGRAVDARLARRPATSAEPDRRPRTGAPSRIDPPARWLPRIRRRRRATAHRREWSRPERPAARRSARWPRVRNGDRDRRRCATSGTLERGSSEIASRPSFSGLSALAGPPERRLSAPSGAGRKSCSAASVAQARERATRAAGSDMSIASSSPATITRPQQDRRYPAS